MHTNGQAILTTAHFLRIFILTKAFDAILARCKNSHR